MQKRNRQLLVELIRLPILLAGFVVKTIYRTIFGWWLDPWLQRKANESLLEDVRATLSFLFSIGRVIQTPPNPGASIQLCIRRNRSDELIVLFYERA